MKETKETLSFILTLNKRTYSKVEDFSKVFGLKRNIAIEILLNSALKKEIKEITLEYQSIKNGEIVTPVSIKTK